MDRFVECWEGLEDPRTGNAGLHDFYELLIIALCAVLCGGQSAVGMALFAKAKEPFLRGFLELKNGLPSHDTFSRLFRLLDPAQFGAAFQRFMARFSERIEKLWGIRRGEGILAGATNPSGVPARCALQTTSADPSSPSTATPPSSPRSS
jgi:hypothetical protein